MKSKVLSIYLPQFHSIPQNDEWWGKGFTEWTNVRRGKPYYKGHYQPREPLNDDYYDLSDLKVLEKHTKMARKAGIAGFCFYHYYFKGQTLLEKPIEQYRDSSKETFPYCLIWANQSWTRTWYRSGTTNRVLLQQNYGRKGDWAKHFYYLLDFFKDDRYIKIDNKPLYIIYIPQDIRCRKEMFQCWEDLAKENGFAGMFLIAMDTGWGKDKNTSLYDAYMKFEPLNAIHCDDSYRKNLQKWKTAHVDKMDSQHTCLKNWLFAKNAYSYSYLCQKIEREGKTLDDMTYGGVFAGWDNTSRKDEDGMIVSGCTPQRFGKSVERMLRLADKQEKRFVFLNAWNEWSEGAYIEPDKRYGYAYLNELRRAIRRYEFDNRLEGKK